MLPIVVSCHIFTDDQTWVYNARVTSGLRFAQDLAKGFPTAYVVSR